MNIVVSNEGERYLVRLALRIDPPDTSDWILHLYKNDYTPTKDVELSDLEECDLAGYSPEVLDVAEWAEPTTIDGQAVSQYGSGLVSFPTASGTQNQYGFFLTADSGSTLLWAARFDAPQALTPSTPVVVQLSFAGRSQSEPS